jgi:hypothetical protein
MVVKNSVAWSPWVFSSIERGGERAPYEECGYKKAWSPRRSSPIGKEKERVS